MKKKKVLFLDRDGILVVDDQVDSFDKIIYIPHVFDALRRIRREGDFEFVMMSNQDGVGTPSFIYEDYLKCHNRIMETLEGEDIYFDDINIDYSFIEDNCPTRKPLAGMARPYMESDSYDIPHSFMVGDRITDMELAKNIGCKGILLNSEVEVPEDLKEHVALQTGSWLEIASFLLNDNNLKHRTASINRKTKETEIELSLDLDGTGKGEIVTSIGFFDHMLEQLVKHSRFDIRGELKGDFEVDEHHSVEDLAIVLGSLVKKALGEKRGIERYGFEILTMDDVVATVALDFSGRAEFIYDVDFKREYIGQFPTEMIKHFFKSFSNSAEMNLYIKVSEGNSHHQAEAIFKAFARAMRNAVKRIPGENSIQSTKGIL